MKKLLILLTLLPFTGCTVPNHAIQEEQMTVFGLKKLTTHVFRQCHWVGCQLVKEALHGFVILRRGIIDFNNVCHNS